uniref:NOT2/NOT3/NOT5 C-terminal domain-containing protein n=1 Tax=Oryza meridionalis TaxID=40149 RepID=A0A0E0CBF5_9ORYZ
MLGKSMIDEASMINRTIGVGLGNVSVKNKRVYGMKHDKKTRTTVLRAHCSLPLDKAHEKSIWPINPSRSYGPESPTPPIRFLLCTPPLFFLRSILLPPSPAPSPTRAAANPPDHLLARRRIPSRSDESTGGRPIPPPPPPLLVPQARADSLPLSSNLNNSASNLQDSTGRPFTGSFSGQSGSVPGGFHHSGLHNMHGSLNMPNLPGSFSQRNAAMSGLPSSGVQQPGGSMPGRFTSNNLPVGMSQIPHGHSGVGSRGLNVGGGPAFSSSLNIGGTIQGLSSNLGAGGSRNSVPGMSVSPSLGNLGPRITGSVGNIVGGSNIGRNISSGGLSVPSIASHMNLSGNVGSGGLNVQGSSRMMNGILQQGSPQMLNMMGSSYPTSGGSLSQNQIQGGNNSLGSMGMLHDASDGAPFDMSDFPQLTGRPSSAGGPQGQYGSLRKQGVGVNTIVQQNQEFSIQNEDFPALPGYKGNTTDYAMELHHKEQLHDNVPVMQAQQYPMSRSVGFNLGSNYPPNRQQHQQGANSVQNAGPQNIGLRPLNSPNQTSSLGSYEQLIQQYQQPQAQNPFRLQQVSSATQSYRDQSLKSIQGGQTPSDPYGLMGLLGVIRMNDVDLSSLALGIDLTTLGLNLNSPDNLYKTFGSPWSNEPAKGEPEFHTPACYSAEQSPPLQPIHFQKFQTPTLFYIFYSMPRDEAQLCAASELYTRGWFYHKEVRVWLTRIPNVEPLVKTPHYERGSYGCFDPNNWETIRKDNFVLHYDQIEKKPAIPSSQNVRYLLAQDSEYAGPCRSAEGRLQNKSGNACLTLVIRL